MDEQDSPILEETSKQMDIVPYTRKDRYVTLSILLIVVANFAIAILTIPWGSLF